MKVLDYAPIPFNDGSLSLQDRMKGISNFGFTWVPRMKSQELIIRDLNRVLDFHYTLLRNIPLPDGSINIPLVLLGPNGISVLNNSITKGMFRAEGDDWEEMDNRLRDFKETKPNLITRTRDMAKVFQQFLQESGYEIQVDGILIFTDPGTHVNTNHPNVRVILMDAIQRFGVSLLKKPQVMTLEEIRQIVNSITEAIQPPEIRTDADRIVPYQQFADNVDSGFLKALNPIQRKMDLSRPQWILLGVFALIDILVLIGFVIFILMTA